MQLPYEYVFEPMEAEDGGGLVAYYPTLGRGACYGRSKSGDIAELMQSLELASASYVAFLDGIGEELPMQLDRDRRFVAEGSGLRQAPHLTVVNGHSCIAANNNYAFAG